MYRLTSKAWYVVKVKQPFELYRMEEQSFNLFNQACIHEQPRPCSNRDKIFLGKLTTTQYKVYLRTTAGSSFLYCSILM